MIAVNKQLISQQAVDEWYVNWNALREQIHAAHEARNGQAEPFMHQGIEHFLQFLMIASEVEGYDTQASYELLPLNGGERLAFIRANPAQYASYRQLDELYKETKKRCARLRLQI
ncbi:hypothetical protein A0U40_01780 [[Bacillus] sp. KCTC 13219]|uniref:YpoC family protein n=1 Tax=Metasolibacillus fluoroglycofenilyticus TaxID=1239396 RepID=UPI000792A285|nr:hypothetical protein [Metasolibacillus fluoroglycofenilyticus]KYG91698.1 hypothetical protein A0U40_01780 [[Bacillus] sp. KCTC 13219]